MLFSKFIVVNVFVQLLDKLTFCLNKNLFPVHHLPIYDNHLWRKQIGQIQTKLGKIEPNKLPHRVWVSNIVESQHINIASIADGFCVYVSLQAVLMHETGSFEVRILVGMPFDYYVSSLCGLKSM